jgi:anti-sigma factor RsiW
MEERQFQEIKETGWRRVLSGDEKAALQRFLAAHPEAQEAWREEEALNHLLERLPVAPVSTNFTARVLQAAQAARPRSAWRDWFAWYGWLPEGRLPRLAMCFVMIGLGLFSFRESQAGHRAKMARELAGVSRVAALPSMEWLKDFDTINRISQVKVADDDLLAALE